MDWLISLSLIFLKFKNRKGKNMKKIIALISFVIISCFSLTGCGDSDLLNLDEPAFNERYEEITDALYIACSQPLLSTELYDNKFDYEDLKYGIPTSMLDETLIDVSTVNINKISDVYKPEISDSYVKFCGVDISFQLKNSGENKKASFLLVLTDGNYGSGEYGVLEGVKKGFTDVRSSCDSIPNEVDVINQYVSVMKDLSNPAELGAIYEIDYYASTIDMEYLNKMFSEKAEKNLTDEDDTSTDEYNISIEDNNNQSYEEQKIKEIYRSIILSLNENSEIIYKKYFVSDINNDGIQELIVYVGNDSELVYQVITYKDGADYYCGSFNGSFSSDSGIIKSDNTLYKYEDAVYVELNYQDNHEVLKLTLDDNLNAEIEPSEVPDGSTILNSCDFSDLSLLD